jgi:hypothetical protein
LCFRVGAKSRGQRAMPAGGIDRKSPVKVHSRFHQRPGVEQRNAHEAMCYHERIGRLLLLGER